MTATTPAPGPSWWLSLVLDEAFSTVLGLWLVGVLVAFARLAVELRRIRIVLERRGRDR